MPISWIDRWRVFTAGFAESLDTTWVQLQDPSIYNPVAATTAVSAARSRDANWSRHHE